MTERFDVIVVGAGPAGSAAALALARKGVDVLLLEKSSIPGQRNMTGGVLFGAYLDGYGLIDLIPDFEKDAPLERKVHRHQVFMISRPSSEGYGFYRMSEISSDSLMARFGLVNLDFSTGHDYSVLRARFDKWMAGKVTGAGGLLATGTTVQDLLWDGAQVVGVRTDKEELFADLVVDASGVTSLLVEKAGLRPKLEPEDAYHGVKEVYKLDERIIDERFGLQNGEGTALFFLGDFMHGVSGGAFVYTNRESLSVGIVAGMDSLVKRLAERPDSVGKPLDILEEFTNHPMISRYLEGAEMVEYSAHNIPKGPKTMLAKPYANGFLVTGDSLGSFVKIGPMIDGIRRAIASGIMAAQTYLHAKERGRFSEEPLSIYGKLLEPIRRDINRSRWDSRVSESRITYEFAPKLIFSLLPFLSKKILPEGALRPDLHADAIMRVQDRTGTLDYDEDREYSHILVNYDECATSEFKSWISLCPTNCYTLVLQKGVFASYKDLYDYNLSEVEKEGIRPADRRRVALARTFQDIRAGRVRFDHVACVACGTCGVIGPRRMVSFGHEVEGHGVRYRLG